MRRHVERAGEAGIGEIEALVLEAWAVKRLVTFERGLCFGRLDLDGQYRLITREPEGILVVQGGPGTGKTAVGLHRASWLLYTYRRELERSGVLVVGPNPVFIDYITHVLPMLGEERVEQRAVDELVAGAEATRRDPPEAARL
jgi:hypothetical protein